MINEIWKPVVGYEGLYEVSNYGNVKSLERYVKSSYNSVTLKKEKNTETNNSERLSES